MQSRVLIGLIILFHATEIYAQNSRITWDQLGMIYADAVFQLSYKAYIDRNGEYVPPLAGSSIPVQSDTLIELGRKAIGFPNSDSIQPFDGKVSSWRLVMVDDRIEWISNYQDTQWAYLGGNFFTQLDTMATPIIRAHLQAYLGSPTHTAIETYLGDPTIGDGMGQFEYWIVVNDSIPVMIMDVLGPFDRGIILATDHRYRSLMFTLRQSLLAKAIRQTVPQPYVDYYYNKVVKQWYSTGFDGNEYFTRPIDPPDFDAGRPVQGIPKG